MAEPGDADDADAAVIPGDRYEQVMRRVGLIAGPVVAALVLVLYDGGRFLFGAEDGSAPASLPALMALCVIWWITEALPSAAVAMMAACLAVLTGLADPKEAFGAFGTPLLFLFVGSFFVAEAMKIHGLGERMARAMTGVATSRRGLLAAVAVTSFVLSMFMSNAAATAIVLPIVLPIAVASGDRKFGAALVLCVAWGASVGGIGTPVGTPPNLIGLSEMRRQGHDVSFLEWMSFGVPIGLVMLSGMLAVLTTLVGVRRGPLPPVGSTEARAWCAGERSVVIAFAIALTGWLLPTVLDLAAPDHPVTYWVKTRLTEEVVAMLAGCSLFVLPGGLPDRKPRPALLWSEATRIDWGVMFLFGGGILLGELARRNGLSEQWGRALVDATGASSTWAITALVTAIAIVLSEMTSNTATATLMAPLAGNLALAAGGSPIPAVLGATLGSSFGFMLPISTAPNAMAYATGRVRIREMMQAGIVFDVVGFVLIVGGLRVLCPLLGLS